MCFTSTKTTVCAVVKAWLFFITYSHILLFLAICDHNLHRNTYFLVFLHNEIVIRNLINILFLFQENVYI